MVAVILNSPSLVLNVIKGEVGAVFLNEKPDVKGRGLRQLGASAKAKALRLTRPERSVRLHSYKTVASV